MMNSVCFQSLAISERFFWEDSGLPAFSFQHLRDIALLSPAPTISDKTAAVIPTFVSLQRVPSNFSLYLTF